MKISLNHYAPGNQKNGNLSETNNYFIYASATKAKNIVVEDISYMKVENVDTMSYNLKQ